MRICYYWLDDGPCILYYVRVYEISVGDVLYNYITIIAARLLGHYTVFGYYTYYYYYYVGTRYIIIITRHIIIFVQQTVENNAI